MSETIDSAFGAIIWVVFVLGVITTGLSRMADPPLSTLAEDTALIFVFGLLFLGIARVLYDG